MEVRIDGTAASPSRRARPSSKPATRPAATSPVSAPIPGSDVRVSCDGSGCGLCASVTRPRRCGLCAVRIDGGSAGEAWCSPAAPSRSRAWRSSPTRPPCAASVWTAWRDLVARHPHVCLSCPDRDGCTRQECTYGIPAEARCCDEFGRCEFGKLVAYIDPGLQTAPAGGRGVPRDAQSRGTDPAGAGTVRRLRPVRAGLQQSPGCRQGAAVWKNRAGGAARGRRLRRRAASSGPVHAAPKKDTLRASGCTFCGQCVMVCPTGAVTAPGEAGSRWLEGWRKKDRSPRAGAAARILASARRGTTWRAVPAVPGVFQLADDRWTGAPHRRSGRSFAGYRPRPRRAGLRFRRLLPVRTGSALHPARERAARPLRAARGTSAARERSGRRPVRRRTLCGRPRVGTVAMPAQPPGAQLGAPFVVGVISDTHGHLYPRVARLLEGVDHIIHAGDIGSAEVLRALRSIAPVVAVRGNCDLGVWADALPSRAEVELAGVRIVVGHVSSAPGGRERRPGHGGRVRPQPRRPARATRPGPLSQPRLRGSSPLRASADDRSA